MSTSISVRRLAGVVALAAGLFTAAQVAQAHEYKLGPLEIEHPWARATPAGAQVGGGFMTIVNHGTTADRLVSFSTDVAARGEIHEMAVKDGVMTMRPLAEGLEVPAGGEVVLKPGSFHLMLMGLKAPLKEGTRVPGTLTFEKAGTVQVEFAVEGIGAGGSGGADHGHMNMKKQ